MTELERVSQETMRFMRGKYKLDEVPGKYYDIDCLKFRQGKRTILSINIHEDHYDFQIIYGKAEREKFEARLDDFPQEIQELYSNSRTLADGLWMLIRVDNLEMLEAVKQMIPCASPDIIIRAFIVMSAMPFLQRIILCKWKHLNLPFVIDNDRRFAAI